jgi:hypothetical protein
VSIDEPIVYARSRQALTWMRRLFAARSLNRSQILLAQPLTLIVSKARLSSGTGGRSAV